MIKNIKDIKHFIELEDGNTYDLNKERLYNSNEISKILLEIGISKYNSAKKLNERLEQLNLIYRHRTEVWDITQEYEQRIDQILLFDNGKIKWTLYGVELILNLVKENEPKKDDDSQICFQES